jgi:hypothetical protein
MTTPSNPSEPPDQPANDRPGPDSAPDPAAATPAPGTPPPATPPTMPTPAMPPPAAPEPTAPDFVPGLAPFAPVARAPRTPWVNPARRGHVAAAVIVGALVFGGGGVLVGHALTGDGHDRDGFGRFERGPGMRGPDFGPHMRPQPGGPRHNVPNVPSAPSSAPSGSATS